jgi:chemotaxis protein MotA
MALKGVRPDWASFGGLALAFAGVVGGLLLEGGELKDISQLTAALIVLGGTGGAVLVSTPAFVLRGAVRRLAQVFFLRPDHPAALIETLLALAAKARKSGLVSLEDDAIHHADPFLSKALTLAVDGTDLHDLRKLLELDIALEEQQAEAEARAWEAAGGFAPTIGIIGAVMGLIQVMKNLANIDAVGHGIAVAFVATVYGVGAANLLFLPAANKIKARAQFETRRKELIIEGVAGILEGLNPKLIAVKLSAFAAAPEPGKRRQAERPVPRPAEASR